MGAGICCWGVQSRRTNNGCPTLVSLPQGRAQETSEFVRKHGKNGRWRYSMRLNNVLLRLVDSDKFSASGVQETSSSYHFPSLVRSPNLQPFDAACRLAISMYILGSVLLPVCMMICPRTYRRTIPSAELHYLQGQCDLRNSIITGNVAEKFPTELTFTAAQARQACREGQSCPDGGGVGQQHRHDLYGPRVSLLVSALLRRACRSRSGQPLQAENRPRRAGGRALLLPTWSKYTTGIMTLRPRIRVAQAFQTRQEDKASRRMQM